MTSGSDDPASRPISNVFRFFFLFFSIVPLFSYMSITILFPGARYAMAVMNMHERCIPPCSSSSGSASFLLLIFRLSSHRKVSGSKPENGIGAPFLSLSRHGLRVWVCYGLCLVQTVAWSILVKVFGFRFCDSMLLTAYRDISRGQAHDGLWITVVNAHGSRITGHLSWIMEYGVGKIGVCVRPRIAFANGELWLG